MIRLLAIVVLCLGLGGAFTGGVWWYAYSSALGQLAERGRSDLSLASARLISQLQQYRELAVLMADHPQLLTALAGSEFEREQARRVLLRVADKTNALDLHLVGGDGKVLVSAGRKATAAPSNRAGMPSFQRSMQGALGLHHERIDGVEGRTFVFSAPIFGAAGQVLGSLDVDVNIWEVESAWRGEPQAVYFTDEAGVVFITNRSELLYRLRDPMRATPQGLARFGYRRSDLRPFPKLRARRHAGHEIWQIEGGPYIPRNVLHLVEPQPVIGLTGELLLDTSSAIRAAWLQAVAAAAVLMIFAAALLLVQLRRKALTERLRIEAAANSELEARVRARTRALSDANTVLRREVQERLEAEAALKRAQQDLIQAGKLSALGKMSAGLSHELNQPLTAIQSFAENAAAYLARNAPDKAAANLGRISELSHRMGRIIRNLRAFSRQETQPMTDVDLGEVIDTALELSERRIAVENVRLDWSRPENAMRVCGGEVRLQQVVINLISNALDAMIETPDRHLRIMLEQSGAQILLSIADNGPGIAEPDRIFDPFYTTKEVGQAEGMGLGLSISYALVQSFGGDIRGQNAPEGGAIFTVYLKPAKPHEAPDGSACSSG